MGFSVLISLETKKKGRRKLGAEQRKRKKMMTGMMGFCKKLVFCLKSDYRDKNGY